MKRESLMIGDWVYVPHGGSATHYGQVKAIYESCVSVYLGNDSWAGGAESLKPVPLTPEILEKNGFGYIEKDNNLTHFYLGERWWCKDMELHIGTNNKGVYWINHLNNSIYNIYHVHQLQQALRICEIEKEIVL